MTQKIFPGHGIPYQLAAKDCLRAELHGFFAACGIPLPPKGEELHDASIAADDRDELSEHQHQWLNMWIARWEAAQ